MAYGESNGHVLDDITCPVFLLGAELITCYHAAFRIDEIA